MILLVEDNEANQLLESSVLMRAGFAVEVAQDAVQARDILKVTTPELILMDIQLPGIDGLTLAGQLRAEPATAHVPIVALTALAMPGDRERTLEAGCVGYISKPIDTRTFADQVRQFLNGA